MAQGISVNPHIPFFSDIWESKPNATCIPIWYDLNSGRRPLKASWLLNFERSRLGGFLILLVLSIPGYVKLYESPGRAGGLPKGN